MSYYSDGSDDDDHNGSDFFSVFVIVMIKLLTMRMSQLRWMLMIKLLTLMLLLPRWVQGE